MPSAKTTIPSSINAEFDSALALTDVSLKHISYEQFAELQTAYKKLHALHLITMPLVASHIKKQEQTKASVAKKRAENKANGLNVDGTVKVANKTEEEQLAAFARFKAGLLKASLTREKRTLAKAGAGAPAAAPEPVPAPLPVSDAED